MDKQSFNHIVQGKKVTPDELKSLEELSATFPYFQIPHILIAKEYVKQESALAEMKLRTAATYTSDRKNLKKFVLSPEGTTTPTTENSETEILEVQEELLREEIRNEEEPIHAVVEQLPEVQELIPLEETTVEEPTTKEAEIPTSSEEETIKLFEPNPGNEEISVSVEEKHTVVEAEKPFEKPVEANEDKVPFPVEIKKPEIIDEEPSEKQELRDDIQHELELLRKQKQAFEALIAKEELEAQKTKTPKTETSAQTVEEKPTPFRMKVEDKPKTTADSTKVKATPPSEGKKETEKPVVKAVPKKASKAKQRAENTDQKAAKVDKPKKPASKNTTTSEKEVYKAPRTDTRLGYFVGKENENTGAEEKDSGADFILGYLDQMDQKRNALFKEEDDVLSIIEDFIKNDPKISKPVRNTKQEDLSTDSTKEKTFISENLALINASQGNISKAISIYEQLLLKIPHKKSYFAAQIEKLKNQ